MSMDDPVYTLVEQIGTTWRAKTEAGEPALLVPSPASTVPFAAEPSSHPTMAALEGDAQIDGEQWLGYRWSSGQTLYQQLSAGPMPRVEGVRLMLRLLDGIAHTRLTGGSLGKLAADRVLIGPDGAPLLAALLPRGERSEDPVKGCGELLFNVVTGSLPEVGDDGLVPLASTVISDIDPRLDTVIATALEGSQAGYPHVLDLRSALSDYLDDLELLGADAEEDQGPVGALLRRMGKSDDFPALSRAVGALNRIGDADSEKLEALASVILRDFSLTNKVLRLANSASYGQFGGATSTISRAVMVLGFNTVKALALTVMVIEHLTNTDLAGELKDEVVRALFTSLIARKLGERCGYQDLEEVRVSGMFHQLGKLLALYYLHDDMQAIQAATAAGEREEAAARRHLGCSFEELGMGVARSWNLPDKLVASMAAEEVKPRPPRTQSDWLRLFANAASLLMTGALSETEPLRYKRFLMVREQFAEPLRVTERDMRVAVDEGLRDTLREAAIFGLDAHGKVIEQLRKMAGLPPTPAKGASSPAPAAGAVKETGSTPPTAQPAPTNAPTASASAALATSPAMPEALPDADRPEVVETLANCVQEVTETLVGDFKLNDLLRMVLETLYRSLEADQVLLATRSVQRNAVVGRFGFGEHIDALVTRFAIPMDDAADGFRDMLVRTQDAHITDTESPEWRDLVPAWYRQAGAARSVLLLPIVVDRKVVGCLYVAKQQPKALAVGKRELALIKTLRNQAILAIRQKTPAG
ncbi:MAG: HDOD domain-containing protein [Burkholderiales bacterium]|nr:HDOD domain-containing protein [Burkholderiales bacterium]